jgi:hypothetical protein
MRKNMVVALVLMGACAMRAGVAMADEKKDEKKAEVSIRDDCDPTDPTWAPTGGCTLQGGVVTRNEFNQLLFSPNSAGSPIGHPAWRMDPTYFKLESDGTVRVRNAGGRGHTFTEVAHFGGGFVPPLNGTLLVAPECTAAAADPPLAPGARAEVTGLAVGNHLFQCCIHPWMRILVKVEPEESSNAEHKH